MNIKELNENGHPIGMFGASWYMTQQEVKNLFDNMSQLDIRKAVKIIRRKSGRHITLEASGGITLKNVRAFAKTGVDRISIGAITHSAKAIDVSLEVSDIY